MGYLSLSSQEFSGLDLGETVWNERLISAVSCDVNDERCDVATSSSVKAAYRCAEKVSSEKTLRRTFKVRLNMCEHRRVFAIQDNVLDYTDHPSTTV